MDRDRLIAVSATFARLVASAHADELSWAVTGFGDALAWPEVSHTRGEAAPDDVLGHAMSALLHPLRHAPDSLLRRRQRKEHQFHDVPGTPPGIDSPHICVPSQRRLEREAPPGRGMGIDLLQHDPSRTKGRQLRVERRQSFGNQISIHEDRQPCLGRKKLTGEGRLPCTVRPRDG